MSMTNKMKLVIGLLSLLTTIFALHSCSMDDDADAINRPTALVTVRPIAGSDAFVMQLNDSVTLQPTNLKTSPFGQKEVRALVNYTTEKGNKKSQNVYVNWIDSIRTKQPVQSQGTLVDAQRYGNDPIDIVRDWVTVAEDGYLTLRIRTLWGNTNVKHSINLLTDVNPNNPYEVELRHDAKGDIDGKAGDALIAFNLNNMPHEGKQKVRFTLKWKSYMGEKSINFDLQFRPVLFY